MSDVSGGPGWWQASDGKWYPPQPAPPTGPPMAPPPPMPPGPVAGIAARPWWKKKRFIIPGVLLILIVAAGLAGPPEADEEGTSTDGASDQAVGENETTTTEEETTTTEEPTTTSTTLPPTTTTTLPPQPVFLSGTGDNVLDVVKPEPGAAIAVITHDGDSNFIVTALDTNGQRLGGLVNEIGPYAGTVPLDFEVGPETAFFEVQADGNWSIELRPLIMMDTRPMSNGHAGAGDAVFSLTGGTSAQRVTLTHDGTSNFIVSAYTDRRQGMVNEIGPYTGTVLLPVSRGISIVVVEADGNWTIVPA